MARLCGRPLPNDCCPTARALLSVAAKLWVLCYELVPPGKCCLLPDYCCPTARARFSELVVRRRQPRSLLRARSSAARERRYQVPGILFSFARTGRRAAPALAAALAGPSPTAARLETPHA